MCKIGFILISQVHKYKNLHLFKLIQTCFIYCYKYFDQILYAELFFLRKVVTVTTALESTTSNLEIKKRHISTFCEITCCGCTDSPTCDTVRATRRLLGSSISVYLKHVTCTRPSFSAKQCSYELIYMYIYK